MTEIQKTQTTFVENIAAKVNVELIFRRRGKIVAQVEGHNIWTNLGREYLADRVQDLSAAYVMYMGLGIGGDEQTVDVSSSYPALDATYPGQNVFSDDDGTLSTLERPVAITVGVWMVPVVFSQPVATIAQQTHTFGVADVNLGGSYPAIPLSEAGLYLSTEIPGADPYMGGTAPGYIGGARLLQQRVCAYHTFGSQTKTAATTVEVRWQLRF